MNAAKDCTLQEKLLRCAMALILAAGALLASVAASPAYAAPSTVDVSIGGKIPYGGFATTWMSADGNIAYCAEPSSPTPAPGSYSTSPVPSGDVTAAIWYSFGSPGFDASMFPGSWYDGGGWDDAKYAAASHVLIAYAYSGSESAATHGTSAEFASWAKSELIGGTFAKMKAGAGKVSAGFEAFCVRTGGGSQTLVSFSWSTGGVKVAKTDSEAGAEPQGDASLDGASFSVVNETGRYVLVGGKYYADGEVCATIKTAPEDGSHVAATGADTLPAGNYRIVESGAPEGYDASDASVTFTVKADEMRDLTGDPVTDEVFRGGVQVTKSDKELQASEALAGSGHKEAPGEHPGLDGIEFTVTNRSAHKVLVDGEWREPGEAVATLTTAWNDEAGAYTAQTAADALPYGTYDVRETATNGSYLLTDGEPRTFEVRTGGEIVSASADGAALEFRDQVVRNDLELSKKSESDNAGLMVPFAIENAATGETHVLVTDRNGDASTASSWNRHSRDTNANDALLGHEGPIEPAEMDPKAGIWFSLGEDGSSAPVDDSLAALPYGAYTMTELRWRCQRGPRAHHEELLGRSRLDGREGRVDGPRRPGGPAHLHHGKGRGGRRQGRLGRRRGQGRRHRRLRGPEGRRGVRALGHPRRQGDRRARGRRLGRARGGQGRVRPRALDRQPGRRDRLRREPARRAATWSRSRAYARTRPRWRRTRTSPTRARQSTSPSRWARRRPTPPTATRSSRPARPRSSTRWPTRASSPARPTSPWARSWTRAPESRSSTRTATR